MSKFKASADNPMAAMLGGMMKDFQGWQKYGDKPPEREVTEEKTPEVTRDKTILAAFNEHSPVSGKVEKEVKGGYEVLVAGQRAFCPFSQIDRVRKGDAVYVGETFKFLVSEYEVEDGRVNLIVSRRALQEAELAEARAELEERLEVGMTINGTVTNVLEFGAFVDIGGVDGLVPAREISWDKVNTPADYVKPGDLVTVKVTNLDWEARRISLSIRQCQSKPLKPRTPEEIAAEAEAADVREYMEKQSEIGDGGFSSLSAAFGNLKI